MWFNRKAFQTKAKMQMRTNHYSYRTIGQEIFMSKSQVHKFLNQPVDMRISDYLRLCDILDINPLEFINEVEYQLRLL